MRTRPDWFNSATDVVLEVLAEDVVMNQFAIYYTVLHRAGSGPGRSTIYVALTRLEKRGWIEQFPGAEGNYYFITARGRQYLEE